MDQAKLDPGGQPQSFQREIKPRAPIFVIIIAWIMLLGGIGGFGKSNIAFGFGGIALLQSIVLIGLTFGIRHLRRWALYGFNRKYFYGLALLFLTWAGTLLYRFFFITGKRLEAADLSNLAFLAFHF